jgi:carboxypeptidase Q
VRGPVVHVEARSEEEFAKYKGKLKGAIVLTAAPADVPPPGAPRVEGIPTPLPAERDGARPGGGRGDFSFRNRLTELLKQEGVACTLRDAGKEHSLLNMGGGGGTGAGNEFKPSALPSAMITHEGYALLWRLLKRGPVQAEVNLECSFSDQPVTVYNTVAELPGTEKPDEVVILGAHLDSWDLGTGTTDNGTGCMAVLETARVLRALDVKPKRTIRFILFTGEEEGLVGSRDYVKAHREQMKKVSAVLVHDYGTGKVSGIALQGNYAAGALLEQVTGPLQSVGFEGIRGGGLGVPAFACRQDRAEYVKTHHTQSDTFDKAWKDDLLQGTMVLSVWAYNVASLPELLPRTPRERPERAARAG